MTSLRSRLIRLIAAVDCCRRDGELVQELETHIQLHTEDNVRAGMSPAAARRDALIKLGGFQQTLEQCRDVCTVRCVGRLADYATSLLRIGARGSHDSRA